MYAIVPPPPTSTFPSSAIWYLISFVSNIFLISATNSAFASEAPDFPLAPVYLFNPIPLPKYDALFSQIHVHKLDLLLRQHLQITF